MSNIRALLFVGAVGLAALGSARAQTPDAARRLSLSRLLNAAVVTGAGQVPLPVNPLSLFTLRGGAMVSPRGAGLVGVDVGIPGVNIGHGFHGRVDADVIIKANFHGINTAIPVTFDQIYHSPHVAGSYGYGGLGLGAVLGGGTIFDAKLIVGAELLSRIGVEANIHFTEKDTLVSLLGRFHF